MITLVLLVLDLKLVIVFVKKTESIVQIVSVHLLISISKTNQLVNIVPKPVLFVLLVITVPNVLPEEFL